MFTLETSLKLVQQRLESLEPNWLNKVIKVAGYRIEFIKIDEEN